MTKREFIDALRQRLSGLPQAELEERLLFYSEMIDDRTEDGCSEEAAVAGIGSVDEIASEILSQIPLSKIVKEKTKPKEKRKKLPVWVIVLVCLGFPVWFPLLAAAFAVSVSLYAVLWSLVAVAWAVFAALIGVGVGATVIGIIQIVFGNAVSGLLLISVALVSAGLSVVAFIGSRAAVIGVVRLTRKIILKIKKALVKGGDAE